MKTSSITTKLKPKDDETLRKRLKKLFEDKTAAKDTKAEIPAPSNMQSQATGKCGHTKLGRPLRTAAQEQQNNGALGSNVKARNSRTDTRKAKSRNANKKNSKQPSIGKRRAVKKKHMVPEKRAKLLQNRHFEDSDSDYTEPSSSESNNAARSNAFKEEELEDHDLGSISDTTSSSSYSSSEPHVSNKQNKNFSRKNNASTEERESAECTPLLTNESDQSATQKCIQNAKYESSDAHQSDDSLSCLNNGSDSEYSFSDFEREEEVNAKHNELSSASEQQPDYTSDESYDDFENDDDGDCDDDGDSDDDDSYASFIDFEADADNTFEFTSHDEFNDDVAFDGGFDVYGNDDDGSDDDGDYRLPDDVLEDLIIHKGTADKRNLEARDDVSFRKDYEGAQLIELREQTIVKVIEQPKEYDRSALEELNKKEYTVKEITIVTQTRKVKESVNASEEAICPQLVHISDNISSNSSYEECSDQESSLISDDINDKYIISQSNAINSESANEYDDDNHNRHKYKPMSAHIIKAESIAPIETATNEGAIEDSSVERDIESRHDLPPSELLSTKLNANCANALILSAKESSVKRGLEKKSSNQAEVVDETSHEASFTSCPESNPSDLERPVDASQPTDTSDVTNNDKVTTRTIFCNSIDSNLVLVLLRDPICIYGTLKLTPIAGSVVIDGYAARCGEELELFSPRGLCSVHIAAARSLNQYISTSTCDDASSLGVEMQRLEVYFARADLQTMRDNYVRHKETAAALVLLKRNEERKQLIGTLKKYMNENIFPNTNAAAQMERPFHASESRLRCSIHIANAEKNDRGLRVDPQWNQLSLKAGSRLMVIGGKSVGKSTLLRYLINRHFTAQRPNERPQLLFIDLDIGQPELFVPHTISATPITAPLLGPGFLLNRQPFQAFAIGYSNVVLCAQRYMLAVRQLLSECFTHSDYAQLPWLINTMGYNKGFGAELIAVLCELLQPTDVVQLQSARDAHNFDYLMEPHVVATMPRSIYATFDNSPALAHIDAASPLAFKLHVFDSQVLQESRQQRDWEMSGKDRRYANLLARLSDALDGKADWMTDCKPLCASLEGINVVNLLDGDYTRQQILKSMEANLVYLCRRQPNDSNNIVQCFGIAVVRAVDFPGNQIFILPALPHSCMSQVDCLAIGEIPLPNSMLINQGPKVKNMAPFVYNTIEANATKSIKQIFHRPPEFLSGQRNSVT